VCSPVSDCLSSKRSRSFFFFIFSVDKLQSWQNTRCFLFATKNIYVLQLTNYSFLRSSVERDGSIYLGKPKEQIKRVQPRSLYLLHSFDYHVYTRVVEEVALESDAVTLAETNVPSTGRSRSIGSHSHRHRWLRGRPSAKLPG
jgi:hypothetical protein